jgi:hypothetical protein
VSVESGGHNLWVRDGSTRGTGWVLVVGGKEEGPAFLLDSSCSPSGGYPRIMLIDHSSGDGPAESKDGGSGRNYLYGGRVFFSYRQLSYLCDCDQP